MSTGPQPVPRARKPSKEVPLKPTPRVRGTASSSSLSSASVTTPDEISEQEEITIATGREQGTLLEEQREEEVIDSITSPDANTDTSLQQQQDKSVTNNDSTTNEGINEEGDDDEDDDPDYENLYEAFKESEDNKNDVDNDKSIKRARPLSNYSNVAPLPEPKQEGVEDGDSNDNSPSCEKKETEEDDSDAYRFKPKYRAPARPPPGYKKPPPPVTSTPDTTKEDDVKSSSFARNRPVVKKVINVPPTPSSPQPQPKIPTKPPRNRQKPPDSSTPPLLVHPVVIDKTVDSPLDVENEESSSSSGQRRSSGTTTPIDDSSVTTPLRLGRSSPSIPHTQPSTDRQTTGEPSTKILKGVSTPEHSSSRSGTSPVFPPRKAPPPPTTDENSELSKVSPATARKIARVAPPPPKPAKLQSTGPQNTDPEEPSSKNPSTIPDKPATTPVRPAAPGRPAAPKVPTKPPSNEKPNAPDCHGTQVIPEGPTSDHLSSVNTKTEGNTASTEGTINSEEIKDNTSSSKEGKQELEETGEDPELVFSRMNLFSVEMRKVDGQGFGLHIAEGYTQTSKGLEVQGVFVKGIVPGSPAENCGRIRESDMILDIAGSSMIGASLDDAAKALKYSGNLVRLKIGRTFSNWSRDDVVNTPLVNPLQEENESLKGKVKDLEKELADLRKGSVDLTQAVATVTVEKTKLDMQVKSLKDELSKLKEELAKVSEQPVAATQDDSQLKELQSKVDQLNETKASLEKDLRVSKSETASAQESFESSQATVADKDKEISQLKQDIERITAELKKERTEKEDTLKQLSSLKEEMDKLKTDLSNEKNSKEIVTKSLSERIIALESELELAQSVKEPVTKVEVPQSSEDDPSTKPEEDASNKVQEELESEAITTEQPISSGEDLNVSNEEASETKESTEKDDEQPTEDKLDESTEEVLNTSTASEEDGFSFDDLKGTKRLCNSSAMERSKLTNRLSRKKPSRSHVQSLVSLSPFPENMPALQVLEESVSDSHLPQVARKPKSKQPPPLPDDKPSKSKQQPPLPDDKSAPAPKPKPRPQPRKKQSPDRLSGYTENTKTPPGSPSPSKKPVPVPRAPSHEMEKKDDDKGSFSARNSEIIDQSPNHSADTKSSEGPPTTNSDSDNSGKPSQLPAVNPKPVLPKPSRHSGEIKNAINTDKPPAPTVNPKPVPPKPSSRNSDDLDSQIEALKQKDPSELTVKEKRILAQQAMAKQVEFKSKGMPPPLIKKRPPPAMRSESVDMHEQTDSSPMGRSQSMEDIIDNEESPKKPPKRLPPGAFMLGIPMGMPGDARSRSYTVGSSTSSASGGDQPPAPDNTDTHNDTTNNELEDSTAEHSATENEEKGNEVDHSSIQNTPNSTPQHDPNPEYENTHDVSNTLTPELSTNDTVSTQSNEEVVTDDEVLDDTASEGGLLETQSTRIASLQADVEQVLYWSPEVVGIWLTSIGLGQHAPTMKDKDVKGYMLFDLDNARLKSLGLTSGDDRKAFQKEVKLLKPYAEKLKKEHERQKKEEKKRLEQEKKLAKKKKK